LRVDSREITFIDPVQGKHQQQVDRDTGDFVLKRRDGLCTYHFAVVVDDADQGVTNVVRGADLLASTPRQIYLQQIMGLRTPDYLHVPLVVNEIGQKLSKQTLAPAISTADASRHLIDALGHLGQDRHSLAHLPPETILRLATQRWDVGKISRGRALPHTVTNI
jgi:glutamyl-Q tRNA(Asp) synthetase